MRPEPPFILLDFPDDDGHPRRRLFAEPVGTVVAERLDEVRTAIREVERAAGSGLYVVGYVGYEAAPAFDPAFVVRSGHNLPLVWFGLFREARAVPATPNLEAGPVGPWRASTTRERYDAAIREIRDAIERGETDQVNYTMRLRAAAPADDLAFHQRMLAAQGNAYGAYLDLGEHRILSASPELFFRRAGDSIVVRPMKGTARRGRWVEEDAAAVERLAASEKDRAENLMIVDLMRNELGRIAEPGSVRVPRLLDVERYRTVHQMTSTVTATLRTGTSLEEIFEALFPCGSVTGAPKVATMGIIARLEESPREVYCGAVGVVEPGGDCTFNVAIRTLWLDTRENTAEYAVGGGITRGSTAQAEYDEAIAKAALLDRDWAPFQLIETLRFEDGEYARLERHIARLRQSAEYFGFADPGPAARLALDDQARAHPSHVSRRVRLLADEQGRVEVTSTPTESAATDEPRPVGLADEPVDRHDPFLCHKTTRREAYERRLERAGPVFDVLLWNREGELTEFTRGNLVVELDGRLWTPPRECGLLAGCFRAELLERGEVAERVLRVDDLRRARRVWLINSVREWVPVRFVNARGEDDFDGGA